MKIAYLGALLTSDSEFPLIREMQKKTSAEFEFYFSVEGTIQGGALFSIKPHKTDRIVPASEYVEFQRMKDYFDISHIYIINNFHYKIYDLRSWLVWIKFIFHLKKRNVDVLHFTWPYRRQRFLLYFLRIKKVMTVHDPIPHSGQQSLFGEITRKMNFAECSKLLLLSDTLKEEFVQKYNLPPKKVAVSRFGYYDWVDAIYQKSDGKLIGKYILFCGQIQPHKGVDILLEAMQQVHEEVPELICVVAGGGHIYFDIEPYKSLEYIIIKNTFIEMDEMIRLIRGSQFVVCPYKDATQSGIVQLSLSSGTPLVVTEVGALAKTVKNGFTGLVVPPSDKDALAKAIVSMAREEDLLESFRNNIENKWKSDSSWNDIVNDYMRMYDSI